MGRRKLPSIPPNSSAFPPPATSSVVTTQSSIPSTSTAYVDDYNATLPSDPIVPESLLKGGSLTRRHQQQHQQQLQQQAPVYITSSASRPTSAAGGNIFQESRPTSSLSMYQTDVILSRPASAASNYTVASSINPTILAGASYSSKPSSHIRQPVSVRQMGFPTSSTVSPSVRSTVGSATSATARVPNTLARVLLKKELKDVLNQRKQRLEATEIEANQRHYKVQKMLVTGLLPERPEDEIPNIVKCDLPADLVRGVHISMQPPSPATSNLTPRRYPTAAKKFTVTPTQSAGMSPRSRTVAVSKSIACQADELPPVKPTISLRHQLDLERRPQLMTYVGKRSAETQTEMTNYETTTPTVRYGSIPRSSRERSASRRYREQQQQIYNQMPQNHNDLLEITKRYFEDYDRQLREFGERARRQSRRRFDFHDDDDQDDMRKAQVMNELARRKERMCASCEVLSTTDPIRSALNTHVPMSSDYSSHVPHYGSLPRIDFPRGTRTDVRDFTFRQQHLPQQPINYAYNYGSLPRNFERYTSGIPPIEIENEQSFGAPPRHRSNIGCESTSMFNLSDPAYLGGEYDRYDPAPLQQQQQPQSSRIYDQIPGYANDTTNLNQGVRGADMVSQYASYLNSQFQSGLQQCAQLPQPMMPITRYDAPLSDPYVSTRMRDLNPNSLNPNQYHHYSTLLAPKPATMTHVVPTYNQLSQQIAMTHQQPTTLTTQMNQMPQMSQAPTTMDPLMSARVPPSSQVYSRNELNYGSRPAQSSLFEYGNRRQYPGMQAVAPTYDVPSTSDWRTPGAMQHHTYDARWPKEDALSRMYQTASRRRAQGDGSPSFLIDGR